MEVFCTRLSRRNELLKLNKEKLVAIAQYYEVAIGSKMKMPEVVQLIGDRLGLPDPEKEEAARLKQEQVKLELEMEKLRFKEKEELKTDRAHLQLENNKMLSQNPNLRPATENRFDPISCLRLIPKFNVTEVGVFFEAFERIAEEMNWPREKWTLLIQGSLEGKAQEAYAALDATQCKDYDVVKKKVLAAYELVPEAYRQQFRSLKRKNDESFLEFSKRQELVFGRWLASTGTTTFERSVSWCLWSNLKSVCPSP